MDIILLLNVVTMQRDYELNVNLKNTLGKNVFSGSYKIALRDKFVTNKDRKEHGLRNHVHGFLEQLKLHNNKLPDLTLSKWDIYAVKFSMNVGSEINMERPSIVFNHGKVNKGEDVIVIPLTSALRDKHPDAFDVFLPKDRENNLYQNSYVRLRQLRPVSLKRIGKAIGTITDERIKKAINDGIKNMLGIEV